MRRPNCVKRLWLIAIASALWLLVAILVLLSDRAPTVVAGSSSTAGSGASAKPQRAPVPVASGLAVVRAVAEATSSTAGFVLRAEGNTAVLTWTPVTDPTLSYIVLRIAAAGPMLLPTSGPLPGRVTTYTDMAPVAGLNCYLLVFLERIGSCREFRCSLSGSQHRLVDRRPAAVLCSTRWFRCRYLHLGSLRRGRRGWLPAHAARRQPGRPPQFDESSYASHGRSDLLQFACYSSWCPPR